MRNKSVISRPVAIFVLTLSFLLASAFAATAQRRITPVTPAAPNVKKEQQEFDRTRLQEQHDAQGRVVLVDTVTGEEFVDSLALPPAIGNVYPLIAGVNIAVDVWDPVMRILGQEYGLVGFMGQLSLHNRYFPTIELGLSMADITPTDMNFTFKSPMAPYFKIGADYNIFYNSNNAYQLHLGLRYGFSAFTYSYENIDANSNYWEESDFFNIPSQKATVGYWEFTAGVQVRISGPISLGWAFKYNSILHESKNTYGPTMYVPGFGKRSGAITGSFYVIYNLPLNKSSYPKVYNNKKNNH